MLFKKKDLQTLNEDLYTKVRAEFKIQYTDYNKNTHSGSVGSMNELVNATQGDPVFVLQCFENNMIRWVDQMYDDSGKVLHVNAKPVIWPEHLMQIKVGNCVDFAIFIHLYCQLANIPNLCVLLSFIDVENSTKKIGHMFTIFQDIHSGKWYVWNYIDVGYGFPNGPYNSPYEAIKRAVEYFNNEFNYGDTTLKCKFHVLTLDDIKVLQNNYKKFKIISQINLFFLMPDVKKFIISNSIYLDLNKIQLPSINNFGNITKYLSYMQKGISNKASKFIRTQNSKIKLTESGIILEPLFNKNKIKQKQINKPTLAL